MKGVLKKLVVGSLCFAMMTSMIGCNQKSKEKQTGTTQGTSVENTAGKSTEKKEIKEILELDMWMYASGWYAGNAKEDIVKEAIAQETGIRINEVIVSGQDISDEQKFNLLYSSGDLPALWKRGLWGDEANIRKKVLETDIAYQFTDEELQKYIPDIWSVIPRIAWETNRLTNGKHMYILEGVADGGEELEKRYPEWTKNELNFSWDERSTVFMRDDILKEIYPHAKTWSELEAIIDSKGKLDWEDIYVPEFDTVDGLYAYLAKVKEKYGDKIIPFGTKRRAMFYDFTRLAINYPIYPTFDPIKFEVLSSPDDRKSEFESYVKDLNKLFNEGLMDKEFAIHKDDMFDSKLATGMYAVAYTNSTAEPKLVMANNALIQAGEKFRYRQVPVNYGHEDFYNINGAYGLETPRANAGWVLNKKKIKQEDVPKVLNYLNYFATDEGMKMVVWGPEDSGLWVEKNGKREWASQEFKDVITGDKAIGVSKDFDYYGLYAMYPPNQKYLHDEYWRVGTAGENPYLPTVEVKIPLTKAVSVAAAEKFNTGYWDFTFFAWNSTQPSNNVFWALTAELEDHYAKAIMSKNEEEFKKYMERFYKAYYEKAKYSEMEQQQHADYIEFLKKFKDYHRFPEGSDLSKLN